MSELRLPQRPLHRHVCGCGDYLVCSQELDKCAVREPFQCPSCEQSELDNYIEQQQMSYLKQHQALTEAK